MIRCLRLSLVILFALVPVIFAAESVIPAFSISIHYNRTLLKDVNHYLLSYKNGKCAAAKGTSKKTARMLTLKPGDCRTLFEKYQQLIETRSPPLSDFDSEHLLMAELTVQTGGRNWMRLVRMQMNEECDVNLNCRAPDESPLYPLAEAVIALANKQ